MRLCGRCIIQVLWRSDESAIGSEAAITAKGGRDLRNGTRAREMVTASTQLHLDPRQRIIPLPLVFLVSFIAVVLTHLTLLHLPYFWDEGGYYVPAALDFYRTGTLIPVFTNAHPPLPNVVLGLLYHLFGFHILVTRLAACGFAAGALTAVFALGRRLLGSTPALVLSLLTAVYPIWFAQSSLAHADIFAACFTLSALALYLASPDLIGSPEQNFSPRSNIFFACLFFYLSVLSKETAILQPLALLPLEAAFSFQHRLDARRRNDHLRWLAALASPVPVLAAWYAFHYRRTGFMFGNPVFLRYNATANFTVAHVLYGLRIRLLHLTWQRNLWVPLTLALACFLLPSSRAHAQPGKAPPLARPVLLAIATLVLANWLAFSVLGGALLTRYLLPVYPLLLLLCVALWQSRTGYWTLLAAITGAAFVSALWINPQAFFAPEDNLTYRDMIVVQQQAIDFLNQHFPEATVLTAWPVAADLTRPELGYTQHVFRVHSLDKFTVDELAKAAQTPGQFDTALVFTTHYTSPAFRHFLLTHPNSWRARHYSEDIDLTPADIARRLGGEVVWQTNRNGEWAAVLRFHRSYDAELTPAR